MNREAVRRDGRLPSALPLSRRAPPRAVRPAHTAPDAAPAAPSAHRTTSFSSPPSFLFSLLFFPCPPFPSLSQLAFILASFAFSLALGYGFIRLLRSSARSCVASACWLQVLAPAVSALGLAAAGQPLPALFFALLACLNAVVFRLWRPQLELVSRLLGVAAAALNANPHLVSATLALQTLLAALAAPVLACAVLGLRGGDVAPNPAAAQLHPSAVAPAPACADAAGAAVDCCVWQPSAPAAAYAAFAAAFLGWLVCVFAEARVFATSHVVTRWYFAPAGTALPGARTTRRLCIPLPFLSLFLTNGSPPPPTHPLSPLLCARKKGAPVREALALAAGPQLGSLAKGGAVLAAAGALRRAADQADGDGHGGGANILACLVAALARCVATLLEYLTKFATARGGGAGQIARLFWVVVGKGGTSAHTAVAPSLYYPPARRCGWR